MTNQDGRLWVYFEAYNLTPGGAYAATVHLDPEEDGANFILVLGPDRHLWLYPDAYYRRLLATMKHSPLPDRQSRRMHLLTAMARVLKTDAQGRVVLPEKSMSRAIISDTVTLVGVFDHVEIWPRDEWESHVAESLPSYGEMLYEASERAQSTE